MNYFSQKSQDLTGFRDLIQRMNLKARYFIAPALFSLGAALFDGLGIALLIPLLKGVIENDFSFATTTPVLKEMVGLFPESLTSSNTTLFIVLVVLIFTSAVFNQCLLYCSSVTTSYLVRRISNQMRKLIFNRYVTFGKLFFDQASFSHLNSILIDFINNISRTYTHVQNVLSRLLVMIVYFGMMFLISWKITLILLLLFPFLHYAMRRLILRIKKLSENYVQYQKELSRRVFNTLTCIALVKVYGREEKEKENFAQISDVTEKYEFKMDKKVNLVQPVQRILMLLLVLTSVILLAMFVRENAAAQLPGLIIYFYLLKENVQNLGVFNSFRAHLANVDGEKLEILRMFQNEDKHFIADGNKPFTGLQDGIDVRKLNFSYYPQRQILKDVSFCIRKGKVTALVGPSGAGKTTIIHLLLRLYDCPPQSIFLDGVDIREFTVQSLTSRMALVSQETFLVSDTLRNNILYGRDDPISDDQLTGILKRARLHEFVLSLPDGLETPVGDRGVKLSGGEKQRVSIARAILKNAEILILDEATSSLDTRTENLIQEAITEAIRDRTTIVIAHRLNTIRHADRIVVIENGMIAEEGDLTALLERKGRFHQYWQEQRFY